MSGGESQQRQPLGQKKTAKAVSLLLKKGLAGEGVYKWLRRAPFKGP
jgi:hypothetical protein